MNLHERIHAEVLRSLKQGPSETLLNNALRLLAKYRSTLIQNTLVQRHGIRVMSGPFAGMEFVEQSIEGCHVPKLLGCYEQGLHGFVGSLPKAGYDTVINIGCAEGYYAVGFKRLLKAARVLAYDTNPLALTVCKTVAARNGVEVETAGEFRPADFADFAGKKVLVWCDIEGSEADLLDPIKTPALLGMDLVVELHLTSKGHSAAILPKRFAGSHNIEMVQNELHKPVLPAFLKDLGHLDQLLAQWEWRMSPTPWAIMLAKAGTNVSPPGQPKR
jgi:hypothetical protein